MLTQRQKEALEFIAGHIQRTGTGPSQQEIADALDLKTKASANRLVKDLDEKGFLRRMKGRARAIEVIARRDPDEPSLEAAANMLVNAAYEKVAGAGKIRAGLAAHHATEALRAALARRAA